MRPVPDDYPEVGDENPMDELERMFGEPESEEIAVAIDIEPCPCCGGLVEGFVCQNCGWDEFGGNIFMRREPEAGAA